VDKIPEDRDARLAFLERWAQQQRGQQAAAAEEQAEQRRLSWAEQTRRYAELIPPVVAQARRRAGHEDSLPEAPVIPVVVTKPSDLPADREAVFTDLMDRLREYRWVDPIVSECDEPRCIAPEAIARARRHRPGAPWLLYMEDDVILGPDFGLLPGLLREADEIFPYTGIVSFFSVDRIEPGWSTRPMQQFAYLQCAAIRNSDFLSGFQDFVDYVVTEGATRYEFFDVALGAFLAAEYDAFALWCPSLVQHADLTSVRHGEQGGWPKRVSWSYEQAYG
jgi:hypothetical protein